MKPETTNPTRILFIAPHPKDLDQYYKTLQSYETIFVAEASLDYCQNKNENWDVIIIGDYLEANPLDIISTLKETFSNDPSFVLILKPGHEKLAVKAIKMGVQEYLFQDELVPSIIHLIVNKSLEQKKWQKVYQRVQKNQDTQNKTLSSNVFSQNFLEMRLKEELKRSKRYQFPVTLLLIKFTDLEASPEKFGPSFGVQAMGHYATTFSKHLRASDMIGLLGNDTLGIVLPHTNELQAKVVWERLANIVTNNPFFYHNQNIYLNIQNYLCSLTQEFADLQKILKQIHQTNKPISDNDLELSGN
ncbi:MAG: hypothetical protein ACD_73C00729G0005 [uncultured bacterium]|nr:MAG: hypothetical protein ACD_73C00729G0005 [uncultured bacterium]